MAEEKNKYTAWAISLLLHGLVFSLMAWSGFFIKVQPQKAMKTPVDITVYEDDSRGAGQQGGGSGAAGTQMFSQDEMILPNKTILPDIHQEYTKEPENEQHYRETHGGTAYGQGGEGQGNGIGNGNSSGQGTGQGDGGQAKISRTVSKENLSRSPIEGTARVRANCIGTAIPVYPTDLQEAGIEGSVTVKIFVGRNGTVERVSLIHSSGYGGLDQAAVAAAYHFRFSPSDSEGYWTKTFTFRLLGD